MIRKKRPRRLSEMVCVFFLCLDEMRWNDADVAIRRIQTCETDRGEDWMRGCTDALQGMLVGLREKYSSPELLILKIGNHFKNELKELEKTFYRQSCGGLNADYDRGFFRAWYEHVKFLMEKSPR